MRARGSVIVFLLAAVLVVVIGLFPSLRPSYTVVSGGQESVETVANGARHHDADAGGSRHQHAGI